MDPLSLTVSILTLVGLSSQCVKVLKSIVLRKSARRLVVDLDDELSELRRDVFAIQELFLRRSKELTSCGDSVTLGDETIGSVVGCLEKVNALVIELHRLLSPLLELYLRSDCVTIQKLMRWPKDQSKLNDIKKDLYNVRIMLNTKLGILDWYELLFSATVACHSNPLYTSIQNSSVANINIATGELHYVWRLWHTLNATIS